MAGPTDSEVSVVVVHFRGAEVLDRCVRSCLAQPEVGEVLVIDNDRRSPAPPGPDPRVRVVPMAHNVGYGRAANEGLAAATAPAVLVLNQDTELPPGTVRSLLDVAHRSGGWLVGPRLVDADGAAAEPKQASAAASPGEPWKHHAPGPDHRPVPWISGAAVLFAEGHTDLRFDPAFHMYVEDEELCDRVWQRGGSVVLATEVPVRHVGATAASQRWSRSGIAWRIFAGRVRMASRRGLRPMLRFVHHDVRRRARRLGGR